jgi:hypothetical protein
MRAPLINPVAVVIERLNIEATRDHDPPGDTVSFSSGYHPDQRAPVPYNDPVTEKRKDSREYDAPIRVPAQVEVMTWERLAQQCHGDAPDSNIVLVTHNQDLTLLGLLRANGEMRLKKGDKITTFERKGVPGAIVRPLDQPLYIYQVMPRSWGFGPLGHDLQLLFTTLRASTPHGG